MTKEKISILFWIIYGFVVIEAVDSFLYLLSYSLFYLKIYWGLSESIINISMPIINIALYVSTAYLLIRLISRTSFSLTVDFGQLKKGVLVAVLIIAIILPRLINRLIGVLAEKSTSTDEYYETFYQVWAWWTISLSGAKWLTLIGLVVYLFNVRSKIDRIKKV